jgi:elongation factor Ts
MVKELREKTGAGMMDCKKALSENEGDMEAAVDWLRTKSLATVAKKAGRVAAEGLIGVASSGSTGAVVEVNSETDFVARNDKFQNMVGEVANIALDSNGDVDAIAAAGFPGSGKTVGEHISELVATIGENMNLRRAVSLTVDQGIVASYVHNQAGPGLGRIGVLVALESAGDTDKLSAFGKQVAMHVAATSPLAVSPEDLDPEVVERERTILAEQARESGKPEEIIGKMVEGRIRKFYEESVLLSQTFVIDGENTVGKAVEAAAGDVGAPIKVAGFVRFALGEGIEKQEQDFAAEVAATAAGA